jgi:hypothetical protein
MFVMKYEGTPASARCGKSLWDLCFDQFAKKDE